MRRHFRSKKGLFGRLRVPTLPPSQRGATKGDKTMSVQDKVIEIIADQLGVSAGDVTPDKTFDELGADSLAVVELVMAFEDEFDVEVEESQASELKTVKAAIDFLTGLTS
jgi:acyl carrier protein